MRDGLLGLILFLAHWLSPESGRASLDAELVRMQAGYYYFECQLSIAWNRQLEQLIDAGIPLKFKIIEYSDKSDTTYLYRSLYYDMVNFTYSFSDSGAQSFKSNSYSLVHLALRDFCRWDYTVPQSASLCKIEVQILPSRAEQLNRVVDMSRIWGQEKVNCQFDPRSYIDNKRSDRASRQGR